jgi:diaminopimelate epimerase
MIPFAKLQGNGNDFILIDEYHNNVIPEERKADFAAKYCHRRFGVGADGVLFLSNTSQADVQMRLFQPDRSEAEMCGNGIRCLVKYAVDKGYVSTGKTTIKTLAGILDVTTHKEKGQLWVKVNMGTPLYNRWDLPAVGEGEFINEELHGCNVSVVNTGVPHAVIISEELEEIPLLEIAPKIRYDPLFPKGTNVNFVKIHSSREISIRTYERGVEAETLSCGTGSVASAAITHRLGKTEDKVTVHTKGGQLRITLENNTAYMEGTAETVFTGQIPKKYQQETAR